MLTSLRAGQRGQQLAITALRLLPLCLLIFLEKNSLLRRIRGPWLVMIVNMPTLLLLSIERGSLSSTQLLQRGLPSRISLSTKIAPTPGWMFKPVFHAWAPPEQPVMPVGQGDRPASDQDEQPVAVEPVIQATASSQKPKPSRPKPARIVTVSRAVAVPAVTAAPRQAATPPRRDSIDSFRGSRMSSRQSNHELVTVQSSDEESTAAQFSPVNEVESENDFSTKSEGSQAQAAVAYSSRGRYRGKGKGKGKRSAKGRR